MQLGETFTIDVDSNDTILLVKQKFEEKQGTAPDQQRLVFAGRLLNDEQTLAECNIGRESILHVVLPEAVNKEKQERKSKASQQITLTLRSLSVCFF